MHTKLDDLAQSYRDLLLIHWSFQPFNQARFRDDPHLEERLVHLLALGSEEDIKEIGNHPGLPLQIDLPGDVHILCLLVLHCSISLINPFLVECIDNEELVIYEVAPLFGKALDGFCIANFVGKLLLLLRHQLLFTLNPRFHFLDPFL